MTELIFLSRIMDYDGGSRGTIYFWPRRSGVLTLWTGLRTMRILSCPLLIASSEVALEIGSS